jgi:hypothetical protein
MKALACFVATCAILAAVNTARSAEPMAPTVPVPYLNGPFIGLVKLPFVADSDKPVVVLRVRPIIVALPEVVLKQTEIAKTWPADAASLQQTKLRHDQQVPEWLGETYAAATDSEARK